MPDTTSATFESVNLRGVVAPLSWGVLPSTFTLYALPQDGLDISSGTLNFSFGTSSVSLTGCAVAATRIKKAPDNNRWPIWEITVLDRRWQWAGKTVSGDYNRRASDGTLDATTQKTPAELASVCLQAMGESGFDTSQMPQNVKPRFKFTNAEARWVLDWLCDYVACRPVLNPLTNAVEIWPCGVGASTPDSGGYLAKYKFVPRNDVPGTIQVVCGESQYQTRLKLQCVLRNYTNGQSQLLANWSDKPSDWTTESPFSFPSQTDANKRAIEYEAAYREFRVTGQQDGSLAVPNCAESITSVDQYLLNDYLLETETDVSNFKRNLPCYLDGDYYAWTDLPNNTSSARYTGSFALHPDRRLVKTPFPVFKLSSSGAYNEPALYLTTSYRVRSTSGETVRLKRQGNVGGSGGTLVLRRPELFAIYSSSTAPGAQTNTESQAAAEADAYVALFQQKYADPTANEMRLPAIVPFTPDGRISQVTWSWFYGRGDDNYTLVCENFEGDISAVDANERRRRRQLAMLTEAA